VGFVASWLYQWQRQSGQQLPLPTMSTAALKSFDANRPYVSEGLAIYLVGSSVPRANVRPVKKQRALYGHYPCGQNTIEQYLAAALYRYPSIAAPGRNIPGPMGRVEQLFGSTQLSSDRVHPVPLTRHTPPIFVGCAAGTGVGAGDLGAGRSSDGTDLTGISLSRF
jgi:hypothetical protein